MVDFLLLYRGLNILISELIVDTPTSPWDWIREWQNGAVEFC